MELKKKTIFFVNKVKCRITSTRVQRQFCFYFIFFLTSKNIFANLLSFLQCFELIGGKSVFFLFVAFFHSTNIAESEIKKRQFFSHLVYWNAHNFLFLLTEYNTEFCVCSFFSLSVRVETIAYFSYTAPRDV